MSSNVAEQIEVLKQQIRVYADDFSNERSDRERIQAEKEMLKEKNKACEDELALLKQQVMTAKIVLILFKEGTSTAF